MVAFLAGALPLSQPPGWYTRGARLAGVSAAWSEHAPSAGPRTAADPLADLVRRAQAGEEAALVALVREQQRYVYSIALSVMRNEADAADMTQEAFVRLLRSLPSYRGETRFTTWLYRLVYNICLDGLRRRGRPLESLDEPAGSEQDEALAPAARLADSDRWVQPEERLEWRESAAAVRAALRQLPLPQRAALTMYYLQEMRYEEIAEALDLPLNTVKSHIRRGKARLAALLGAEAA